MSQPVLVIHGAGEPRRRHGRIYWEPLLGDGLGPGYQVRAPRMPDPEEPNYQAWADRIAELLRETETPVLVGHSFGASVLLKYLGQVDPRPAFRGLFLVATPFWKATDFSEFALTPAEIARLQTVSPVVFYHSRDDEDVSFEHLERYARVLPQALVHDVDGRGHEFNQDTFPELVGDIRRLAQDSWLATERGSMINSPSEPIPAAPVRRASASLPRAPDSSGTALTPVVGAHHCREVVAQSMTPNDFPRLISLVSTLAPDTGSARALGDGLQWEQDSGYSSLSLTINPEPTGIVIRADLRTDGEQVVYGLGAFGAGLLAAIAATGAHFSLGGIVAAGLSTLAASAWIARGLWRASSRRQGERLQRLVSTIAAGLRGELD